MCTQVTTGEELDASGDLKRATQRRCSTDMSALVRLWKLLTVDERGQGLAEYGLIIVLVAIVAVSAVSMFGGTVSNLFTRLAATISSP